MTQVEVSKLISYSVMELPDDSVGASKLSSYSVLELPQAAITPKLTGYAVVDYLGDKVGASKLVAYAVMDLAHAQVYTSKLVGYAVMSSPIATTDVGRVIRVTSNGVWTGDPVGFAFEHRRNGVPIPDATAFEYTVQAADIGAMLSCMVYATNAAGAGQAISNELGAIRGTPYNVAGDGAAAIPKQTVTGAGSATGDPHWSSILFLSGFAGVDGGGTFADEGPAGLSVTRSHSNVITSTTRSKFGGSSLYTPGGGPYRLLVGAAADFNIAAAEDFTIESWINLDAIDGTWFKALWGRWLTSGDYNLWVRNGTDARLYFAVNGGNNLVGVTKVTADAWHHVAVARESDTLRIFLNGNVEATETGWSSQAMTLGGQFGINGNGASNDTMLGWQDEFRFTRGVARYTAAFTPPTSQFPRG